MTIGLSPNPLPPPRKKKASVMKPSCADPRCGRCNRKLKDPESIRRGFGRTCYGKHVKYTEQFCMNLFEGLDDKPPVKKRRRKKREETS